jgi:hypothetical protein
VKFTGALLIVVGVISIVILTVVGFAPGYIVIPLLLLIAAGVGILVAGFSARRDAISASNASTLSESSSSPPGWYPANDGSGRVMYWNGNEWDNPPAT